MKTRMIKGLSLASIAVLMLTACNDDNTQTGSTAMASPSEPPPSSKSITVTPSLGKVSNGVVELLTLDGALIAQGNTSSLGQVSFTLPAGFLQPFMLRVCGSPTATYFDEGLGAEVPLASDQCLRAVVPDSHVRDLTISAYTEAATRLLEHNSTLATAHRRQIRNALATVQQQLGLSSEVLVAPIVPANAEELGQLVSGYLQNTVLPLGVQKESRDYGYALSALAKSAALLAQHRGATELTPAYSVAIHLADDLADGVLDGQDANGYIVSTNYDIHQLNTLLASVTKTELQSLLPDLPDLDLTSEAGRNYLTSLGLKLPVSVSAVMPVGGDSILSWQGTYRGTIHVDALVQVASMYASYLPQVYRSFLANVAEGNACYVTIKDNQMTGGVDNGSGGVADIPFSLTYSMSQSADTSGARSFAFSRSDSGFVPVSATGTLKVQESVAQQLYFDVDVFRGMFTSHLACQFDQ